MIPKKWRIKFLNWLGAGNLVVDEDDDDDGYNQLCVDESPSIDITGLSFNVMPAQGGVIVQIRKYDDKINRNNYTTHIIAEGQDVAETVGKIVAMELWKH